MIRVEGLFKYRANWWYNIGSFGRKVSRTLYDTKHIKTIHAIRSLIHAARNSIHGDNNYEAKN